MSASQYFVCPPNRRVLLAKDCWGCPRAFKLRTVVRQAIRRFASGAPRLSRPVVEYACGCATGVFPRNLARFEARARSAVTPPETPETAAPTGIRGAFLDIRMP